MSFTPVFEITLITTVSAGGSRFDAGRRQRGRRRRGRRRRGRLEVAVAVGLDDDGDIGAVVDDHVRLDASAEAVAFTQVKFPKAALELNHDGFRLDVGEEDPVKRSFGSIRLVLLVAAAAGSDNTYETLGRAAGSKGSLDNRCVCQGEDSKGSEG